MRLVGVAPPTVSSLNSPAFDVKGMYIPCADYISQKNSKMKIEVIILDYFS